MNSRRVVKWLGCVLAVAVLSGCRSETQPRNKPFSAKGTVTKIDLAANRVSMKTLLEKSGKEAEIEGEITQQTEVTIGGKKAQLSDVEINDQVQVEAYQTGAKDEKRFVVTRVEISRPEGWKSTKTAIASTSPPPLPAQPAKTPADAPPQPTSPAPTTPPTTPPPATEAQKEQKRAEATNQVYAMIRERMQEAVQKRSALLKAGRPQNDEEVLNHEKIIRNARALLMEIGENLPPVDPPLPDDVVPAQPATPPTTQPAGSGS